MAAVERRLPSGIIKMWRQFLLGYDRTENHRYTDEMSSRSPPLPDLPPGPNHRLFDENNLKEEKQSHSQKDPVVHKLAEGRSC
uniref:Uncharacterized protein n=1 Tax=Panstrongylus lignarius TaxID=156445 RepID=A0A224XZI2_9HEMI